VGEAATFCAICGAAIPQAERQDDDLPLSRPRDIRRWAIIGAAVALLAVAGVATDASFASRRAALTPAAPPLYRLTQFSHLQAGMTPARVAATLGTSGSAFAAAGAAASAPQFYVYLQNTEGQSLQLYFQNGVFSQGVPRGLQ
jgi:hypothetical protein